MALLELNNVTVSFPFTNGQPSPPGPGGALPVCGAGGSWWPWWGPSGRRKTTALNVLAGQVRPTQGQVRLAGEPVEGLLPSVGYISQADTLLPWRTVLDNVALAMEPQGVPQGPAAGDRPGPDGEDGPGGL